MSVFFFTSLQSYEEGHIYNDDIKIVYRDYGPKDAPVSYTHLRAHET